MAKMKIHINELGPVKDSDIELAPMMIYTGASGLGKSYVNFLTYYVFNEFANEKLSDFLTPKIEGKKWEGNKLSFFFTLSDLRTYLSEKAKPFLEWILAYPGLNCSVGFITDDTLEEKYKVEAFAETNKVEGKEDLSINECICSINGRSRSTWYFTEYVNSAICSMVAQDISEKILDKYFAASYILPPGRTALVGTGFSLFKTVSDIGMYDKYLHDYDILRKKNPRFFINLISEKEKSDDQFFLSQIQKLIHGELVQDKDGILLKLENGQSIPLSAAASSIRELSPLLFWIQNRDISASSVCLEEPEAHAHPEMQFDIADLLASCINKGAYLQITTHSDYILSRLNQLIRLYKFQQKDNDAFEKSEFVKSKRQLLNPQNIKAYHFIYSGEKGHVVIKNLDLNDGIPFDSFRSIITKQILFDDKISKLVGDDDE